MTGKDRAPDWATRLLIIDPRPIYRAGLRAVAERDGRVWVVGEGATAATGRTFAETTPADVAIISDELPDGSGLELAWSMRRFSPLMSVILQATSASVTEWTLIQALKCGIAAILPVDASAEEAVDAIQLAHHGGHAVSTRVLSRTANDRNAEQAAAKANAWAAEVAEKINYSPLTPREATLLNMLAQGLSNKEIAQLMVLSPQTVKNHVTNILRKLEASSRTDAVLTAMRHGWVAVPAAATNGHAAPVPAPVGV